MQATNWASRVEVTTDGTGVVGHVGAALLRALADRVGLTAALGWQGPQGRRRHPDAAVLRDLAVVLADGGDCLSGLAALGDQPELFGPVASTPTAWRVVERLAQDPDGLARVRTARAHARRRAWAVGGDPDLEQLIVDAADATLVLAHSDAKQGAAGTYKPSFGFCPLLTLPGWSCGIANAPGWRTASAPPQPPGWATSRSTCCAATLSGWSWSWPPKTSPAGRRPCCWTASWPWPNPRRCATACCTWPPGSSATLAESSFACNAAGRGRPSWHRRSPGLRALPLRC